MSVLSEIREVSSDAAAALQNAGFTSDTDIRSLTRQDLNELIHGAQHLRLRQTIGDIIQNVKPLIADDCVKGFVSDPDIRSLTRQDLNELFPGPQNLRLRKTIGDIIQNVKPLNAVSRELFHFIPDDCVKVALTNNGVLNDYLVILRDMKTKVESVHSFLDAHIGLFKEYTEVVRIQTCDTLSGSSLGSRTATGPGSVAAQSTVRVKVIVKGQTFGCHRTLLQRVSQLGGLHVDETDSGPEVVIVFCPVKTRHMTDIEAAMKDVVPGGAAVILVVMHHTYDVDYPHIVRSLGADCGWDFVNVLYHDTVPGLLPCTSNEQAVAQLHGVLLKHSSVVSPVAATAAAVQDFNPQQAGWRQPTDRRHSPEPPAGVGGVDPRDRILAKIAQDLKQHQT